MEAIPPILCAAAATVQAKFLGRQAAVLVQIQAVEQVRLSALEPAFHHQLTSQGIDPLPLRPALFDPSLQLRPSLHHALQYLGPTLGSLLPHLGAAFGPLGLHILRAGECGKRDEGGDAEGRKEESSHSVPFHYR
jgi:hypothetical protein